MQEPTVVVELEGGDRDVVGYARDGDDACVAVLRIRGGKLLARDHRFLENIDGDEDAAVLAAYLARSYLGGADERAAELLVPFDFEDRQALEDSLARTRSRAAARLAPPARRPRRAERAAPARGVPAVEHGGRGARRRPGLRAAAGARLRKVPRSLVCFDISHAQGTDTVRSCVWFENGAPSAASTASSRSRRCRGSTTSRRCARWSAATSAAGSRSAPLPDLVVIDGGKGQLNAAHEALDAVGLGEHPLDLARPSARRRCSSSGRSEPLRIRAARPGCACCSRRATRRTGSR
jgi:excinuclease ABC subunit C